MKWWLKCVRDNYATFRGRARRREYWMFTLFNVIFIWIAMLLDNLLGTTFRIPASAYAPAGTAAYGWIYTIFCLATLIPMLSVTVRRLHDTGRSGLWLAGFYIGEILLALLAFVFALSMPALAGICGFAVLAVGIWLIVLLCLDSHPGENDYGANPKAEQAA